MSRSRACSEVVTVWFVILIGKGTAVLARKRAMHLAVDITEVFGVDKWHVAVDAFLRLLRIIERSHPGPNTLSLPVVVVIKATHQRWRCRTSGERGGGAHLGNILR
jgi:hypothetical protein